MRGSDERTGSLYSFVDLDERVPEKHSLRKVRQIVNDALATLDADFSKLYAAEGRPSIAPERLRLAKAHGRNRRLDGPVCNGFDHRNFNGKRQSVGPVERIGSHLEPAEQQVIVKLLHQLALGTDRVERLQE